ncbi:7tm Chemosensory receptor family protein [Acanthocheilonema viteae]
MQNGRIQVEMKNDAIRSEYWTNKQIQKSISIPLTLAPLAVPEHYISSSSEDASDIIVIETIVLNDEMEKKDERDVNVKEEVKNSLESMLSPLITYMQLLGFINATNNERLRKPLLIYNILVIICLNSHTIHKFLSLSYDGFTVRFAFTTANALFLASGGICVVFLYFMQKNLALLNENVINQIPSFDQNFYCWKRIRQICKLMVAITFISSSITVLLKSIQSTEIANINSTFHIFHFFIDYYVAFMAQSALMSCTIIYFLPNYILARCLDKFTNDMYRVGVILDDEMTSGNALNELESFQKRYQILKKAANIIEFIFKYIAFYVQTVCLIELSCKLYAYLQNLKWNWFDTILFIATVSQIILYMLSFIVPAYLNYEKNKKISEICPEMFEKQMQKDSNVILATKVLMFMYQLETMPIIFTSGGFFIVKRSLLPTLVSFMLTYVFLMLQLGQTSRCAMGNMSPDTF